VGLLDTLLGRTKPVKANLDQLFALSGAAITLQAATGLVPSGRAGVCAKPPTGPSFAQMQRDIDALLSVDGSPGGAPTSPAPDASASAASTPPTVPTSTTPPTPDGVGALAPFDDGSGTAAAADLTVRHQTDGFGYSWVVVDGGTLEDLVTRVHMVHSSLEDAGWGTQLLCSVFGFHPGPDPGTDPIDTALFIVYLAKRGTFYPFAPTGRQRRDSELELRVRSVLGADLPIESDLTRWFPLWDLPVA
jgi:hypothetical protein